MKQPPPADRVRCSSAHCLLSNDVACSGAETVPEGEACPFGAGAVEIGEGSRNLLGARHDLIEAAIAIFAAENPVACRHLPSPYAWANWAASVESPSAV